MWRLRTGNILREPTLSQRATKSLVVHKDMPFDYDIIISCHVLLLSVVSVRTPQAKVFECFVFAGLNPQKLFGKESRKRGSWQRLAGLGEWTVPLSLNFAEYSRSNAEAGGLEQGENTPENMHPFSSLQRLPIRLEHLSKFRHGYEDVR